MIYQITREQAARIYDDKLYGQFTQKELAYLQLGINRLFIPMELFHECVNVYFDGCEIERDCECCGDRWYRAWNEMNYDEIQMFGEYYKKWTDSIPSYAIYYPQVNRIVNFYTDKIEVKRA